MSRSQSISPTTIRAIYRLVHEICELGNDPSAWRLHMLAELGRLTGSKSIRSVVIGHPIDVRNLQPLVSVDWGVDEEELKSWRQYIAAGDYSDNPMSGSIMRIAHRSSIRTRDQLCEDRVWYDSSYFNEFRRPIRCDHLLNCTIALPQMGVASMTSCTRALGDPPYTRHEVSIAGLFHSELRRIWRTPPRDTGKGFALTPRQQQILDLMTAGDVEKQIAGKLGLSRHTVHNYIRAMYRRAGVNTRSALLAKTQTPQAFRPQILLPDKE